MASYKIIWKKTAFKELNKIPTEYVSKILDSIEKLADNPFPSGVKKLSGSENNWRIKVADYRIIYEIEQKRLVIQIIKVRHRKDVYKK